MKQRYLLPLLALFFTTAFTYAQDEVVTIPDADFLNKLVNNNCVDTDGDGYYESTADLNGDGQIQVSEAEVITSLIVSNGSISDLTGIEAFVNLQELECKSNQLTSLDVSNNVNLEILKCDFNQLTSLVLGNNVNLQRLLCGANQLTTLDVSNNVGLQDLFCHSNQLTTLDVSNNVGLQYLDCHSNQLTSLDVSNNVELSDLHCADNQLTTLDLSNNINLDGLSFHLNQQLVYVNLKNGNNSNLALYNNDDTSWNLNLQAFCVDDINSFFTTTYIQDEYPDTVITSYCTFTPGGEYYTVTGNVTLDENNNGCDANNSAYPNLTLNVEGDTAEGAFFSNNQGFYNMPIQAGTYTITPQLENLDYFTVTPTTLTVDFPTDASPYTQDFCVTPDGVHNDLEITIVPLEQARPGFDTDYKLVYKNKGGTTLSGIIDFTYNDDLMELLVANPTATTATTGNLSWDYIDLLPLETREIEFTMTLNTPTDATFPLNGGDVLNYTASITPDDADETPDDNIFVLDQTVVNSYDPNDKTCLEGETIEPEDVGKYVHYLIRFENTGSASAVNIVVKDVIDTAVYDLNSLVPLSASHEFFTRIRNGNEVEFIFENINLPFEDETNDGYVLFKIKTVSTLVEGDSFNNEAEIYFDFNAPIITNDYSTLVQESMSVGGHTTNTVKLFPNPVTNSFEVVAQNAMETIAITDINGRVISELKPLGNALSKTVDVSGLSKGIYFVTVTSGTAKETFKIIKE